MNSETKGCERTDLARQKQIHLRQRQRFGLKTFVSSVGWPRGERHTTANVSGELPPAPTTDWGSLSKGEHLRSQRSAHWGVCTFAIWSARIFGAGLGFGVSMDRGKLFGFGYVQSAWGSGQRYEVDSISRSRVRGSLLGGLGLSMNHASSLGTPYPREMRVSWRSKIGSGRRLGSGEVRG